ncbi:MAG: polysaccharide deacetylase family protein [Deltaproteobacteria bacterium]
MSAAPHPDASFLPEYPERVSRQIFLYLQRGLYWSRAGRAFLFGTGAAGAIIWEYHSVAPPDEARWIEPSNRVDTGRFERQIAFLARRRNVVSMDELVDAIQRDKKLPAGSVVLTFDDGYRDNYTYVASALAAYDLPATLYLPTGLVTRQESPWADRIYTAFKYRRRDTFEHPDVAGSPFDLRTNAKAAYGAIASALLDASRATRDDILAALDEQLDPEVTAPCLTLDWATLRKMQAEFPAFQLGVHSVNHIDLTAHGEATAAEEIDGCVEVYERELGAAPRHFAYPYDRHDAMTHAIVSTRTLASAVCNGPDVLIDGKSDPFALPRLAAPDSMSLYRFWSSGAYPGLPRALFGRA